MASSLQLRIPAALDARPTQLRIALPVKLATLTVTVKAVFLSAVTPLPAPWAMLIAIAVPCTMCFVEEASASRRLGAWTLVYARIIRSELRR